jgi:pheromone a factor receptor
MSTDSDMSTEPAPLHAAAIIFPLFAFPSWILCIPPLVWHFSQRNAAAGSLILWVILLNFFNSINPLIWPRDNLTEWWSGNVWCDINVRIQIGAQVGMVASIAMILRKLAIVMDTRNITVSTSRSSRLRSQILEFAWCCGYPFVLIVVYYTVQSIRYFIYAIEGCISGYHVSWASVVLGAMWAPITMVAGVYYAGLCLYRLFRYRQEFSRLLNARNTTKSRFIRLFTICIVTLLFYVPYNLAAFWLFLNEVPWQAPYNWDEVHGPKFNTVIRVPTHGQVHLDKWGQVMTGYVIFLIFGTGSDAYDTYKKILIAVGLGKVFPSLYIMHESGGGTPSSFISARGWTASCASKAKSIFSSRSQSVSHLETDISIGNMRNNSVVLESIPDPRPESSAASILPQGSASPPTRASFFNRFFTRGREQPILPVFSQRKVPCADESAVASADQSFSAHVWAADDLALQRNSEPSGVQVIHEIHQAREERGRPDRKSDIWAVGKD